MLALKTILSKKESEIGHAMWKKAQKKKDCYTQTKEKIAQESS